MKSNQSTSLFHRKKATFFTLIELLVVVAIIGILVSILLPALSSARKKTEMAVCMSNLKQIYTATAAYSAKNNNFFPQSISGGGYVSWDDNLSGYDGRAALTHAEKVAGALPAGYQDTIGIYRCPSSPDFLDHPYFNNTLNGFMRTYAINQMGANNKYGGVSRTNGTALNMAQINKASTSILYVEKKWCGMGASDDLHYAKLMWQKLFKPNGPLDYGGAEFHEKKTNYSMIDGSVIAMTYWKTLQNGTYNDVRDTYWDALK